MSAIATYVFFDIETTGLPYEENNKTKITEISFVAVKREHFLQTKKGCEPRVQQKLTLCLNPGRIIQPGSTRITGLCNEQLEKESSFNEHVFTIIQTYLSLLTTPICLIAHNGHSFDFPILKYQLLKLGVDLDVNLMCADSLDGFYDITVERKINNESSVHSVKEENTECGKRKREESNSSPENNCNTPDVNANDAKRMKKTHEKKVISPLPISRARRKIFYNKDTNGKKPDKSYKLMDIYRRLFNKEPENSHRAENDCLLLLKCSLDFGETFVQWVDENHCLFSDVKHMTQGRRLGF